MEEEYSTEMSQSSDVKIQKQKTERKEEVKTIQKKEKKEVTKKKESVAAVEEEKKKEESKVPGIKEPAKKPTVPAIEIIKEKTPEPGAVGLRRGSKPGEGGSRRGSLVPEGAGERRASLIIADETGRLRPGEMAADKKRR